jgi:hypothetical protein
MSPTARSDRTPRTPRRPWPFVVLAALLLAPPALFAPGCGDDDDDDGNPAGVGNYCERNEDCMTGECYLGPGGGYCTSPCDDEGSLSQCPEDTLCKPIQGGPRRCLLICGSVSACDGLDRCDDEFCPQGSSCVSVSNTDRKGCEPDPG